MSNPFTPPDGPFGARPGFGFGFGPGRVDRRALHDAKPGGISANICASTPAATTDRWASVPDSGLASAPGSDRASAARVAASAVTCAPPCWHCWPSARCTATR